MNTTMEQAGKMFDVNEKYHVELPGTSHIIIVGYAMYGTPAAKFQHPNVLKIAPEVMEFKHSRSSGYKWWTALPGYSYYFCIPTSKIEMVKEEGYSYVPIIIGGQRFRLNVSGGTNSGHWVDWVRQQTHTSVFKAAKYLRILAENAVSPETFAALGIELKLHETNQRHFDMLVARRDGMRMLTKGKKIVVMDDCTFPGSDQTRTLTVDSTGYIARGHRRGTIIAELPPGCTYRFVKIKKTQVDWLKTVELWKAA